MNERTWKIPGTHQVGNEKTRFRNFKYFILVPGRLFLYLNPLFKQKIINWSSDKLRCYLFENGNSNEGTRCSLLILFRSLINIFADFFVIIGAFLETINVDNFFSQHLDFDWTKTFPEVILAATKKWTQMVQLQFDVNWVPTSRETNTSIIKCCQP